MLKVPRPRLTYANVVATLALFIALGGSSYAALKISGGEIKAHTITGKNIKRNSLGRRQVKESSLSAVPPNGSWCAAQKERSRSRASAWKPRPTHLPHMAMRSTNAAGSTPRPRQDAGFRLTTS
jgi:hypothetical protein